MDREAIITLAADIVSAHVGNNLISGEDLPKLIKDVATALHEAAAVPAVAASQPLSPAIGIKDSEQPGHLVCLDCGEKLKMLTRHLRVRHGLSANQYRARWGLPSGYSMTAADYSARRRELAIEFGLGRKVGSSRNGR